MTPDINDFADGLGAVLLSEPSDHSGLLKALAARADDEGLVDVAFRRIDSPYGPLLVAATSQGIVRLAFTNEDHDRVLEDLARQVSPRILETSIRTEDAARQLDEYFNGARQRFDLAADLRLVHGFRREVIAALCDIPYGETSSYGAVADAIGSPKAVRAVGSACAHNPVPILIPCHRVVRSDGTIGQYLGGTDTKRALLAHESA